MSKVKITFWNGDVEVAEVGDPVRVEVAATGVGLRTLRIAPGGIASVEAYEEQASPADEPAPTSEPAPADEPKPKRRSSKKS